MKFNKSDILKMGGAAVLTALAFLSSQFFQSSTPLFSFAKSERISWKDAMSLRDEYRGFKPLQVRYGRKPGDTIVETLNGFVFNAKDLDSILHNKKATKLPDEVIFYLGQKGKFSTGWLGKNHANMHVIAAGMKESKLLYDPANPGDKMASYIYDKADPCPPNCPNNIPY